MKRHKSRCRQYEFKTKIFIVGHYFVRLHSRTHFVTCNTCMHYCEFLSRARVMCAGYSSHCVRACVSVCPGALQ